MSEADLQRDQPNGQRRGGESDPEPLIRQRHLLILFGPLALVLAALLLVPPVSDAFLHFLLWAQGH